MNPACENCDDEDEISDSDNIVETHVEGNQDSLSSSVSVAYINNSIVTSFPSSMVSHWTPITHNLFQNAGCLTSMVVHCYKLPLPGDTFISMEEVMEQLKKMFDRYFKKLEP